MGEIDLRREERVKRSCGAVASVTRIN